MRPRRLLCSVFAVVAVVALFGVVPASSAPAAQKLSGNLAAIAEANARQGEAAARAEARNRGMEIDSGRIRVVVTSAGNLAATRNDIERSGGWVDSVLGGRLGALVPPGALRRLEDDSDVTWVGLPLPRRIAAVDGEGVPFVNATQWQANGFKGSGVDVAVIDLGFQNLAAAQAAGDLPAIPDNRQGKFCNDGISGNTNHGTAVAEIIHEVAPEANLYLICVGNELDDLNQSVQFAIDEDVDIVNHSVSWYNSSRGDGSGSQFSPDWEAGRAREAGILWVNAAGNEGRTHFHGVFPNENIDYFKFTSTDTFNDTQQSIPSGELICAYLKWDRWGAPTSIQNYDVSLWRRSGSSYSQMSLDVHQEAGPTEAACGTTSGLPTQYAVRVRQVYAKPGFPLKRFDLFVPGFPLERTTGSSLTEPASSPSVVAAGAVCWSNGAIESYSSTGPNIAGVIKPDLAAPDSISGTTYGSYTNCGPPNAFPGTSAASPHVAGAAALVKDQFPGLNAGQLQSWLQLRARDQGAGGKDNQYGWGRLWFRWFTDVPPSDYGYTSVELLRENGITSGCSSDPVNTRYCPTADVSRAEMAIFIAKAAGIGPCTNCATPTFADVPASHFAYPWIEAVYDAGITAGCGASGSQRFYCPSDRVTRAQMSVFLMRAAGKTACNGCSPPTFSDVPSSYWAYGWIERLYAEGVTAGCGGSRFCPENNVTRRDMAIFLVKTFDLTDPTPP